MTATSIALVIGLGLLVMFILNILVICIVSIATEGMTEEYKDKYYMDLVSYNHININL